MEATSWAYRKPWRPSGNLLWSLAIALLIAGLLLEAWLPGAFSATGGLAIAVTTPLFGIALFKQQTYELELKLAELNQRKQANLGTGVISSLPVDRREQVETEIQKSVRAAEGFSVALRSHQEYSKSLILAQAWIVGIASAIWATGAWIGNIAFHCGKVTC